jgi:hypothetical protein
MIHPHPSTHSDIASALDVNGILRAYVAYADRLRPMAAPKQRTRAFRAFLAETIPAASAEILEAFRPTAKRQRRKPSIARQIKQAEKTGKRVTSVTTPDGMIINFGEPEPSAANNPWLDDLKVTKQ